MNPRPSRLVPLIAALAGTVALGATVQPAHAYQPDLELTRAILHTQSFGVPLEARPVFDVPAGNGPDGIDGPDGTPDGRGAFRFYRGGGAIYAERTPSGVIEVGGVYGDILRGWASLGYERSSIGYPRGFEFTATAKEIAAGCGVNDRAQRFFKDQGPRFPGLRWTACWDPATRIVGWKGF